MFYKVVENLVANDADHLEGLPRGDRVDEDVAMYANDVLGVENTVFILDSQSATAAVSLWLRAENGTVL